MNNTLLNKEELLSAVNGIQIGSSGCIFTNVETDSRNVKENTMFVPLVGEFQDGHKYIPSALEKGASVVLLNKAENEKNSSVYAKLAKENPSVMFVCVDNTLTGLQKAAEAYVTKKCQNMIKVSITGSCGKTTTKEMMVSVAKAHFGDNAVAYTKGNFNSETGLPLSVFKIRGDEKIGIFEMGMNRVNEIGEISSVFKSKYGIITNIGTAHIGILGSRESIAAEKRKSLDYVPADGAVCVPFIDDFADYCTENVAGKVIKFGEGVDASVSGVKFIADNGLFGTKFTVDGVEVNLPLSGKYNFQNACGVIAMAKELGIPTNEIKSGLENMSAVSGRMEVKKMTLNSNKTVVIVNDCYNANPDSMTKVIGFVEDLDSKKGRKILVLADMKELGNESEKAHRLVGKTAAMSSADHVILIGSDMAFAAQEFEKTGNNKFEYFNDNSKENFEKISEYINSSCCDDDVILFKGSNSMGLFRIIDLLGSKEGK